MTNTINLLTDEERAKLPLVISRRSKIRHIIKVSIQNFDLTANNAIMITGKPGSGKTYLVSELLEQMKDEEQIAGYKRVPGHITMRSMYGLMESTATPKDGKPYTLLLDDVDALDQEEVLEILKAGFDTKSNLPNNRRIYYFNNDTGKTGVTFNGFGIIIANDDWANKKLNVHQQALLDRVQLMSIDLEPNDMMIYTTYLTEQMLNKNEEGYKQEDIDSIVHLFNTDMRRWMRTDAFRRANVNFSVRLVKKFIDSQRLFGNDWKDFNLSYQKLNAAADLAESAAALADDTVVVNSQNVKVRPTKKVALIKNSKPAMNKKGEYLNPKTGKPYSQAMQYSLKKKYA